MKGVIFNVVEEVVTERFGADTWDALLERAGVDGAYTSLGNYEDDEVVRIVSAASKALELSAEEVLRFLGAAGFARLAGRYPRFLEGHTTSRTVFGNLNGVIHPQVLVLYPGATVPDFGFRSTDRRIELTYRSARGLCHLAEGLAEGAAQYFGETVAIAQSSCRHRDDGECVIVVEYSVDA